VRRAPVDPEVRGRVHRQHVDPVDDPARLEALQGTGLLDTDPEPEFDRITRLVQRAIGVPVVLVSLVDRHRQFFKASIGLDLRETPLSHSFCQHVVREVAPLMVRDARQDDRVRENLAVEDLDVIAYAGVPLVLPGGQPIGSLCAIDSVPRDWTDEDLATLQDTAEVVIAELALRETLRRERRVADALQHAMLPERPPSFDGLDIAARYRPAAGAIGGDFYDVFRRGSDVVLVIGDVEGKGIEAAAAAAQLRHAIRGLALEGHGPGALLCALNDEVEARFDIGHASVVVAELDPRDRWLTWAGAGHPPGVLVEDGRARELRLNQQPLLGAVARPPDQHELELRPGATILLATDGLLERPGHALEEALVLLRTTAESCAEDPHRLCDTALETLGTGSDDIAVLAARLAG